MKQLHVLAYLLVAAALIAVLFFDRTEVESAYDFEAAEAERRELPPPSFGDERVLIQAERAKNGLGTAFAINREGQWVTARHVVDGCDRVELMMQPGMFVEATRVRVAQDSDLALIDTEKSPSAARLNLSEPLRIGTEGYHVGYPQGRASAIQTKLRSRAQMVTRGERRSTEPVLAWTIEGNAIDSSGSLGGLSGGPVFDSNGDVRGVVVAESPRRGRIYTTTPESLSTFLLTHALNPSKGEADRYTSNNYLRQSRRAMRKLQVVGVVCHVSEE